MNKMKKVLSIFSDSKRGPMTDAKSSAITRVGVALKDSASSLTCGIVQWSKEGFGYMTR
jgi:hypothetical protein